MEEGGKAAVQAAEFALIGSRVREVHSIKVSPNARERTDKEESVFRLFRDRWSSRGSTQDLIQYYYVAIRCAADDMVWKVDVDHVGPFASPRPRPQSNGGCCCNNYYPPHRE